MCDPITLSGAALTGGSMLANSSAASAVAGAQGRVMAGERARQAAYQQQATDLSDHSLGLYKDFGQQQADKAKSLATYFTQGVGQGPAAAGAGSTAPAETMPTSSNVLVQSEQAKQGAKEQAYATQQGTALGAQRAFGDVLGDASLQQAKDAGRIGQIGSFMKGSASVEPYELDAASHAGDGMKFLGDVLGAGGQIATAAGLTRNVAPGLKAPLPSMANVSPVGTQTAEGLAAALPQQPLRLNTSFSSVPTFSTIGNYYTLPTV